MTWQTSTTASPAAAVDVPACALPDISLVTVTYGTGPIVVDSVASLVESLADSDVSFELIVVDNPYEGRSTITDLTLFTAGVRLVQPDRNLGFGGGCELGAMHARGSVIGFVNPDVIFPAGWLEPLLAVLDRDPAPSIVTPMLLDADGTIQEVGQSLDAAGYTSPLVDVPGAAEVVIVDYASAACWLMRRDEHERLGGFDPAYHPAYFEDVDLALRARLLGGMCAVHTGVSVVHQRGQGTPDRPEPAVEQHAVLMATWPEIAWTQPSG